VLNKRLFRRSIIWLVSGVMTLSGLSSANLKILPDNLLDMSLEDLMEIEIPVTSASRQPVGLRYLSMPVTVITAEDIHYSGLTTIPELLQFTPGVDVRRLDRQRYIVGIRGLSGIFSDRTIILIDGQPAIDPAFSTTHWENLPILMEDIDRIEIIRGPGGAVWGNAFNGAINIITKRPNQCQGGLVSTTISEFGDTVTHLRYGQTQGKWSWKASAGYENTEDSDAAGAGRYVSGASALNPLMGFDSFTARDWGRYWIFNTEAEYRVDEQTHWTIGAAHSSGQEGDFEMIGVFPRRDFLTEYTRLFTRMDHQFDSDTSAYVRWFADYWDTHRRTYTDRSTYLENDFEAQLNFKPTENQNASVVGNFRWNRMSMSNYSSTNELVFDRNDYNEYWAGLFLIDRWTATEKLTLEGQICINHYSPTGNDWSTRLTTLYALDDQQNHIVRAGFARAFRTPSVGLRRMSYTYLSPGMFTTDPSPTDLNNEGTYSLEAGYVGRLSENLSLNIDTYYQRYERLIGVTNQTNMWGITTSSFGNIDGANAYGEETSLTLRHRTGKITAWYAYNAFVTDQFGQITRSLSPAEHKAGLNTRWYLDKDWTLNTNYVFQSDIGMFGAVVKDPHSFHRLDLTLSRKFAKGKGELMFGVTDLLNETTDPVFDSGNLTAMETPGRMFFGRLQIQF
jgi:outer membrane receptor for ferrienterochelin and colicin